MDCFSVTPYYNKPTQEGLYQHYRAIAGATRIADCSLQCARTVRHEPGAGDGSAAGEDGEHRGDQRGVWKYFADGGSAECGAGGFCSARGDDSVTLPLFALGGRGVISVAANEIPRRWRKLCAAGLAGDFVTARRIHRRYLALMEINFVESNPMPVKAAMALMG